LKRSAWRRDNVIQPGTPSIIESLFTALDQLHASTYGAATGALSRAAVDVSAAPAAIVLAFALGMVHALMPGHGKTVLFSYFLGSEARLLTGVGMALKIALLHVGTAVFLLLVVGGAVVRLGRMQGPGRALELASYIAVMLIGAWLLYRAATRSGGGEHDGHRHRRGGILAYAVGLLPCPLTIILMNYALVNETVLGGLLLVAVMAVGIAVTMSCAGMAAILARRTLTAGLAPAWFRRGTRLLELGGAAAIFAIGVGSLARAL
jgi:nickel/cobalt exporter